MLFDESSKKPLRLWKERAMRSIKVIHDEQDEGFFIFTPPADEELRELIRSWCADRIRMGSELPDED